MLVDLAKGGTSMKGIALKTGTVLVGIMIYVLIGIALGSAG